MLSLTEIYQLSNRLNNAVKTVSIWLPKFPQMQTIYNKKLKMANEYYLKRWNSILQDYNSFPVGRKPKKSDYINENKIKEEAVYLMFNELGMLDRHNDKNTNWNKIKNLLDNIDTRIPNLTFSQKTSLSGLNAALGKKSALNSAIDNAYTSFKADVIAAGMQRDGIQQATVGQIKQLYPIYYDEMLTNQLARPRKKQEQTLSGWSVSDLDPTKHIKDIADDVADIIGDLGTDIAHGVADAFEPIATVITDVVKAPADAAIKLVTIPIKAIDPKLAKKIENVLAKTPVAKAINAPSQYIQEHPKVAIALATAASIAIPALRPLVLIGTKKYSELQIRKANDEAARNIRIMLRQAESTGTFKPPSDLPIGVDPIKLLTLVTSPQYFEKIKYSALTTLTQLGYDPNTEATMLLAEKIATANVNYYKARIAEKYPNGLTQSDNETTSIIIDEKTGQPYTINQKTGEVKPYMPPSPLSKMILPAAATAAAAVLMA